VDLEGWVKYLYEEPKVNVPAPVVVSKMEVIDENDEIQKND